MPHPLLLNDMRPHCGIAQTIGEDSNPMAEECILYVLADAAPRYSSGVRGEGVQRHQVPT